MQHQPAVMAAYQQVQTSFHCNVLGMIEIGSYARDEAVTWSDRDIRLIVQNEPPYLLLREHPWTAGLPDAVSYVDWSAINHFEQVTFGITNLAFVEAAIQTHRFPLNDHTCLYQGKLLLDETGMIAAFCQEHQGRMFANIVPDYVRQLSWRVNQRLRSETNLASIPLDHQKRAIPVVHTCCRIMRDMANIESYRTNGFYIRDFATLTHYYQKRWPEFFDLFQAAFCLKRDQHQRELAFNGIDNNDDGWINTIREMQDDTKTLWMHFEQEFTKRKIK